jgi:hypothetical protein
MVILSVDRESMNILKNPYIKPFGFALHSDDTENFAAVICGSDFRLCNSVFRYGFPHKWPSPEQTQTDLSISVPSHFLERS